MMLLIASGISSAQSKQVAKSRTHERLQYNVAIPRNGNTEREIANETG